MNESSTLVAGPVLRNPFLRKIIAILYWTLPSVFCLVLYRTVLKTWFMGDDFVWLGQLRLIHNWNDLWIAIFQPTVHGTFRPLSERAYFLVLRQLFGFDPLPFRICVLITQFVNLVLVCSIVKRVTGSPLAGFIAPFFWMANSSLVITMAWACTYMQVICGFCLLLPFRLLLAYIDTGKRRYFWWQWAVFLLGFLMMESEMVYPALAASYLIFRSRKHLLSTVPMFAVSLVFALVHMKFAVPAKVGPYVMHFDAGMVTTLMRYWKLALACEGTAAFTLLPRWLATSQVVLLSLGLAAFLVRRLLRRDWIPLVFLSWFLILLVPVLPLKDHVTSYYLTLPLIGTSMLGAYAVALAWKGPYYERGLAAALAVLYLANAVPVTRQMLRLRYERSEQARTLVGGVVTARELHPGKTILLTGVDNTLYWNAIHDGPFEALGIPDVYLAPGSERVIQPQPGDTNPSEHVLPAATVRRALANNAIEVYQAGGPRLKNITSRYAKAARSLEAGQPRRVDAGVAVQDEQFGSDWYTRSESFRWMPKRASLTIAGPLTPGERLYIRGGCVPEETRGGPLHLSVSANGAVLGTSEIRDCAQPVEFDYAFPPNLVGQPSVTVVLELDRTYRMPPPAEDTREFGLYFGTFEVR